MSKKITIVFWGGFPKVSGGAEPEILNTARSIDQEIFEPIIISRYHDVSKLYKSIDNCEKLIVPDDEQVGKILGERADIVFTTHSMHKETVMQAPIRIHYLGSMDPPSEYMNYVTKIYCIAKWMRYALKNECKVPLEKTFASHLAPDPKEWQEARRTFRKEERKRLGAGKSDVVVGVVTRLIKRKNIEMLIKAARAIIPENPNAKFVIVGDGKHTHSLVDLAFLSGLQENVIFSGWSFNVKKSMSAFDVFAYPSNVEGLPEVVSDAIAIGLPILSTRVGGVPEICKDDDAFLVDIGDFKAFTEALQTLVSSPTTRVIFTGRSRLNAKKLFGKYTPKRISDWLYKVYKEEQEHG